MKWYSHNSTYLYLADVDKGSYKLHPSLLRIRILSELWISGMPWPHRPIHLTERNWNWKERNELRYYCGYFKYWPYILLSLLNLHVYYPNSLRRVPHVILVHGLMKLSVVKAIQLHRGRDRLLGRIDGSHTVWPKFIKINTRLWWLIALRHWKPPIILPLRPTWHGVIVCIWTVAAVDIRGGQLVELVLVEMCGEVRDGRIGGGLEAYGAYYLVYVSVS